MSVADSLLTGSPLTLTRSQVVGAVFWRASESFVNTHIVSTLSSPNTRAFGTSIAYLVILVLFDAVDSGGGLIRCHDVT